MCIIFLAVRQHEDYPLILLANRDEYRNRPTAPLNYWQESAQILAGKDLQGGGTWLGVNRSGKLAALTNIRNLAMHQPGRVSRGQIIKNYLVKEQNDEEYLTELARTPMHYNPYNLILGTIDHLFAYNNLEQKVETIPSGIHGLSNASLNTPWPKIIRGKQLLEQQIRKRIDIEALFQIMQDEQRPEEGELPDTGIGLPYERYLSAIFLTAPKYGTRSTSIILMDNNHQIDFYERSYLADGVFASEAKHRMILEA